MLQLSGQTHNHAPPGHKAAECKSNRVLDLSKIASKSPEEAWDLLKAAAAEGDLDDFREVGCSLWTSWHAHFIPNACG